MKQICEIKHLFDTIFYTEESYKYVKNNRTLFHYEKMFADKNLKKYYATVKTMSHSLHCS